VKVLTIEGELYRQEKEEAIFVCGACWKESRTPLEMLISAGWLTIL
jgi:hypothetical protein